MANTNTRTNGTVTKGTKSTKMPHHDELFQNEYLIYHMKNDPEYFLTIDKLVMREKHREERYYEKQQFRIQHEKDQIDGFLRCIKKCINNSVIKKKPFWDKGKYKVTCYDYPQEYDFSKCRKYLHLVMKMNKGGITVIGKPYLHNGYIENYHSCTVKYDAKYKLLYFSHKYIRPHNGCFFK